MYNNLSVCLSVCLLFTYYDRLSLPVSPGDDGDNSWLLLDDTIAGTSSPIHTPTLSRSSSTLSNDVFSSSPGKPPPTIKENGINSPHPLSPEAVSPQVKRKKKSSRLRTMTMTLDRKSASSKQFQEARKELQRLQTELERANTELQQTKKTAEDAVSVRDQTMKEMDELRKQLREAQASMTAAEERAKEAREQVEQQLRSTNHSPRGSPVGACASPPTPHSPKSPKVGSVGQNGLQQLWMVTKKEIELVSPELYRDNWSTVRIASFRGLKVAAQRLNKSLIDENTLPRYIQAMNTACHARHPHLVQLVAATLDPDPLILNEWMPSSVKLLLRQGPIPKQQLLSIAGNIASALTFLHGWRPDPIIHRDVSSSNVYLEPAAGGRWKAKLSNYGISNFISLVSLTSTSITATKSSIFAAPEAKTPELHSPKMDTYSYGVLLLEMCQPQEETSPTAGEIHNRITSIHWQAMADLITSCTILAPDDRPTILDVYKRLSRVNESFV